MEATEVMRLIVAEFPRLQAIARRIARQDGEDLLSTCVERAVTRAHQFDGENVVAWVATLMRTQHLNNVRRVRNGERAVERVGGLLGRADDDGNPERVVLQGCEADRIAAALAALPDHYREAVEAVLVNELPYREAADLLGVAEGTVYSRVNRGRRILQETLAA